MKILAIEAILVDIPTSRHPDDPRVPPVHWLDQAVRTSAPARWRGVGRRAKAALAPAAKGILTPLGVHPTVSASPEDFRTLIANDIAWMADVAKELRLAQAG